MRKEMTYKTGYGVAAKYCGIPSYDGHVVNNNNNNNNNNIIKIIRIIQLVLSTTDIIPN
jgi:hypothetical protein